MAEVRYQFRGVDLAPVDFGVALKAYLAIRGPLAEADKSRRAGGTEEQYKADLALVRTIAAGQYEVTRGQQATATATTQAAASAYKTQQTAYTEEMKSNARLRQEFFKQKSMTERLGKEWKFKTGVSGMTTNADRAAIAEIVRNAQRAVAAGTPYDQAIERAVAIAGGQVQATLAENPDDNHLHRAAVAEGLRDALLVAFPADSPEKALAFNNAASTHIWGPMSLDVAPDENGINAPSASMETDPTMRDIANTADSSPAESYVGTKPITPMQQGQPVQAPVLEQGAAPSPARGQPAPPAVQPGQPAPASASPASAPPSANPPPPPMPPAASTAAPTPMGTYTLPTGVQQVTGPASLSTVAPIVRDVNSRWDPVANAALDRIADYDKARKADGDQPIAVDLRGRQAHPDQAKFDRFAKAWDASPKKGQLEAVYGEIARLRTPDANMRREAAVTDADKAYEALLVEGPESVRARGPNTLGEKNYALAREWSKEWQGIQASIANDNLQPTDAEAQRRVGEWLAPKAQILSSLRPEQRSAIMEGLTVDAGAHQVLESMVAAKLRPPPPMSASVPTMGGVDMRTPGAKAREARNAAAPDGSIKAALHKAERADIAAEKPANALTGEGGDDARDALGVKTDAETRPAAVVEQEKRAEAKGKAVAPTTPPPATGLAPTVVTPVPGKVGGKVDYQPVVTPPVPPPPMQTKVMERGMAIPAPLPPPATLKVATSPSLTPSQKAVQDALQQDAEVYAATYAVHLRRVNKERPGTSPQDAASIAERLTRQRLGTDKPGVEIPKEQADASQR